MSAQEWRETAWNGIRFETPAEWEIASIGREYLLLEDASGPVFELKWGIVRKNFSTRGQLKRLQKANNRTKDLSVAHCPLPVDWEDVLENYDAVCFNWTSGRGEGKGAILYCRVCGTAAIIQFVKPFSRKFDSSEHREICRRVLASYRDHEEGRFSPWQIYDLRAVLPAACRLSRYRFEAGRFELHFQMLGNTFSLFRWGVASFLLAEQDLEALACKTFPGLPGKPLPIVQQGHAGFSWESPAASRRPHRWEIFRSGSRFQALRIWKVDARDRILAVKAAGKKSFDPMAFDRICSDYVLV